jgi:hypothetical protein
MFYSTGPSIISWGQYHKPFLRPQLILQIFHCQSLPPLPNTLYLGWSLPERSQSHDCTLSLQGNYKTRVEVTYNENLSSTKDCRMNYNFKKSYVTPGTCFIKLFNSAMYKAGEFVKVNKMLFTMTKTQT